MSSAVAAAAPFVFVSPQPLVWQTSPVPPRLSSVLRDDGLKAEEGGGGGGERGSLLFVPDYNSWSGGGSSVSSDDALIAAGGVQLVQSGCVREGREIVRTTAVQPGTDPATLGASTQLVTPKSSNELNSKAPSPPLSAFEVPPSGLLPPALLTPLCRDTDSGLTEQHRMRHAGLGGGHH